MHEKEDKNEAENQTASRQAQEGKSKMPRSITIDRGINKKTLVKRHYHKEVNPKLRIRILISAGLQPTKSVHTQSMQEGE